MVLRAKTTETKAEWPYKEEIVVSVDARPSKKGNQLPIPDHSNALSVHNHRCSQLSMSRVPPFPTRRRSPSSSGAAPSASSTRPLQISRPTQRPVTPDSHAPQNTTTPAGPSRPQRSEMRGRTTENGTERSSQYRDSVSTTHSDMSGQLRSRQQPASQHSRQNPKRSLSGNTDDSTEASPVVLGTVVSALQSAASRRRAMTNGSDDFDYQRQRQEEIEAEKARQQRIQEKALRRKGTARTGDIDGGCHPFSLISFLPPTYPVTSRPR
jgi:exocyst complex component 4